MSELFNSLSSDNLVLLCVIMGIVALFLAIAISIEIYNSNRKYQKIIEKHNLEKETKLETTSKINIKESPDIKYVDESDEELEKTKAKLELANLREKLKKEEEEKQKLLEMNLALASSQKTMALDKEVQEQIKEEVQEPIKEEVQEPIKGNVREEVEELVLDEDNEEINTVNNTSTVINNVTNITNEVKSEEVNTHEVSSYEDKAVHKKNVDKSIQLDEALKKVRVSSENSEKKEKIENKKYDSEIELLDDFISDEEDAIISYDELKNAKNFGFTDEEMEKYEDEKDAIISIQELENLYIESQSIEVPVQKTKEGFKNKVEDLPVNVDSNDFHNSPTISSVYGMSKSDQELVLEQTANLEKLNEEIRKTNEFLKTLKDLKKNLE